MFKNSSFEDKSITKIRRITALFVLISIALFIISSLIDGFYTLSLKYGILFKIGIIFVVIFDIIYAGLLFIIRDGEDIKLDNKFIFLSMAVFAAIFISEIFLDLSLSKSILAGVIGMVGLFFGVLYFYFKDDGILSRVMIIIGTIMVYMAITLYPLKPFAYIFSGSYFNSALWAQAFIVFEIFLLLSYVFKDSSIISDLFSSGGKSLAIFIFGIGMLITGGELVTISFPGYPSIIAGSMSSILVIAGIFAIISGIFIIVLAAVDFYNSLIKPRIRIIR